MEEDDNEVEDLDLIAKPLCGVVDAESRKGPRLRASTSVELNGIEPSAS